MEMDIFDKSMGSLGRYQIWLTFLILLTKFPVGWHLLNIIIIGPKPKVTCMLPSNITGCDSVCETRSVDPSPFDRTIHSQWDLVCERAYLATLAQMLMMAGVMLGSFFGGMWSDRQGRKIPLVVSSILQAIAATTIAYVPWFPLFLVLRFVTGFATGGQMTSSFVLLMELIGKKWRVTIGTIYQIPTWFGHLSLSLIGYLCKDWRSSQLVVGVPSFIFITFIWLVPESPRYLVSSGNVEKAVHIIEKIAKRNRMENIENIGRDMSAYAEQLKIKKTEKGKFFDLFRPKPICFRTLILVINWIAVGICFYGVAQYAGQAKGDIFANIAISAAMEIPGTLVAVFLVDKIGRKWTTICTCLVSGIPMLVIPFLKEDTAAVPVMALIALFGLAALFATVYVYSGELYPTFIRSMGVGFVSMTCRIGTISAPFIASLGDFNLAWLPLIIFGVFPLVSGAMVFFLPETKHDQLADTLEDALNLGKKKATRDLLAAPNGNIKTK